MLFGNKTVARSVQFLNVLSEIVVKRDNLDKSIEASKEQPIKAFSLIALTVAGIAIPCKLVQFSKAEIPIVRSPVYRLTVVSPLQFLNALSPIEVILFGVVTLISFGKPFVPLKFMKALAPAGIAVTTVGVRVKVNDELAAKPVKIN